MNLNVDLSEHDASFVEEQVRAGRFGSVSEVVRQALFLLQNLHEPSAPFEGEDLEFLRKAYQEGIASGDAREIDFEEIKREGRRRLDQRT